MKKELTFKSNSLFEDVAYDKDSDNWTFLFAENIYINASGFWRLLQNNQILYVSLDNGHQFGLPKPFNLVESLKKDLNGKSLTKIKVDKHTCDIKITLTCEFKLEIYISSSGYESYDFSIKSKRYIGLGGGDIAIMDNLLQKDSNDLLPKNRRKMN